MNPQAQKFVYEKPGVRAIFRVKEADVYIDYKQLKSCTHSSRCLCLDDARKEVKRLLSLGYKRNPERESDPMWALLTQSI